MTRHRFEPARLVTGVLLCGAAVVCLLDGGGALELPAALLAGLVPAALVLGALTGATTFAVARVRRRCGAPSGGRRR